MVVGRACLGNFHIKKAPPAGRGALDKLQIVRSKKHHIYCTNQLLDRYFPAVIGNGTPPVPIKSKIQLIFHAKTLEAQGNTSPGSIPANQLAIRIASEGAACGCVIDRLQNIGLALGIAADKNVQVVIKGKLQLFIIPEINKLEAPDLHGLLHPGFFPGYLPAAHLQDFHSVSRKQAPPFSCLDIAVDQDELFLQHRPYLAAGLDDASPFQELVKLDALCMNGYFFHLNISF